MLSTEFFWGGKKRNHMTKYMDCQVILLFARKVHCQGGKTNPWIPISRSISLHISCSCHQHSDCGLQFVLVQQIRNSQLSTLHIWVNLSCVLCAWKWQDLPKRQLLLGFWILPIHPYLTPVIIFKKKILGLTPVSLAGPGMCQYNVPSDPNLVDRAQIWQQSKVSSDCLSECSELTQMKFPAY